LNATPIWNKGDELMVEMTSEERVLRALQRQVPDRVPHFEWLVDHRVREALLPGCKDHNDFAVQIGQDAVIVDPIFKKERVSDNRWLSEWGLRQPGYGRGTRHRGGISDQDHGRL
jgi:hypothetical protein